MTRHLTNLIALAACCAATAATAQLKMPRDTAATPAPAVAPAQPAAPAVAQPRPAATATQETAAKELAGKLAAAGWLTLLDRRDWGTAWEASATMFRSTVPLAGWIEGIPTVRAPFGALVERVPGDSTWRDKLQGRPDGDYVSTRFFSKFDKQEVEEFVTTVREPDGRWRVTGYSTR